MVPPTPMNILTPSRSPAGPKEFFLQLLAIITLYISVVSFIILLFQYIDTAFPDALEYYGRTGTLNAIRSAMATLFVVFPVYLGSSWLLERGIAEDPAKAEMKVRKWLLYFTLFIAGLAIIIDLITLVTNFLSGELTVRFLLKVAAVLVVTLTVFLYYLWILRSHSVTPRAQRTIAWTAGTVIFACIISGFFLVGSPFYQRNVRFDEKRVGHLQNIQSELVNTWQMKRALPKDLAALNNSITGFTVPTDPETSQPYEYTVLSPLSFQLCATFQTEQKDENINGVPVAREIYSQNWNHGIGRSCFDRTIDPALYPPSTGIPAKPRY